MLKTCVYGTLRKALWHGDTKSANGLTFMTIEGAGELSFHFQHGVRTLMHSSAGHMVPMDKPMESEVLFKRWLEGKQM